MYIRYICSKLSCNVDQRLTLYVYNIILKYNSSDSNFSLICTCVHHTILCCSLIAVLQCVSRNADNKIVNLECEILGNPQPNPLRSWFKDGELVYSAINGFSPNPSDFFMNNPILVPGVLDPITLSALSDGTIVYNYEVRNITSPQQLPPGTTEAQIEQQVFDLLLGNWTCIVNNTLGSTTITYLITDCGEIYCDIYKLSYLTGELLKRLNLPTFLL